MDWIFNKHFIFGNEILFYIFLGVILSIIIFAIIMASKEIKSDNK